MQLIDLKAQYEVLKDEINQNIRTVMETSQFIGGTFVEELEERLAAYVGRKYCISCGNGTEALQVAFMAHQVGAGDAVFCPDVTFIASVEPAYMLGATPVFCDITRDTYNLDPESLKRQIQAVKAEGKLMPKAVVAVDFLGNPAEMEEISSICKENGLILIEDAAQGFGASYHGKHCCSFGDIATTSFFPAKPLGCYGDGGAIFTDDEEMASICRSICVHGKGPGGKYNNVRIGVNSRLDNMQAAVLLPKLKALDAYEVDKRQDIAQKYNKVFQTKFVIPFVADHCVSVWAQYALLAESKEKRDHMIRHLTEQKIPNMIYYPTPQHNLPVFQNVLTYGEKFENSEYYCAHTFSLPMHPYLTHEEQDTVIEAVLSAL